MLFRSLQCDWSILFDAVFVCSDWSIPGLSAGDVPHVDEHGVEGDTGLVGQLLLVEQSPEQRLCDGQSGVAPQWLPVNTKVSRQ